MKDKCDYCGTSYNDIIENGFVGCEKCYQEIDGLRIAIDKMYGGKKHKGRNVRREYGEF